MSHICLSQSTIVSIGFWVLPPSRITLNLNTYRGNHSLPPDVRGKKPVPFALSRLLPQGGVVCLSMSSRNVISTGPSFCNNRRVWWRHWSMPLNPPYCQERALLSRGPPGEPSSPFRQLTSTLKCGPGLSYSCQVPPCWHCTLMLVSVSESRVGRR